jgi:hypothetical protein
MPTVSVARVAQALNLWEQRVQQLVKKRECLGRRVGNTT